MGGGVTFRMNNKSLLTFTHTFIPFGGKKYAYFFYRQSILTVASDKIYAWDLGVYSKMIELNYGVSKKSCQFVYIMEEHEAPKDYNYCHLDD